MYDFYSIIAFCQFLVLLHEEKQKQAEVKIANNCKTALEIEQKE